MSTSIGKPKGRQPMTNILYEFQITVDGEYQKHYIRAKGMDNAVRQLKKLINNN